jgi:hypothetical protein
LFQQIRAADWEVVWEVGVAASRLGRGTQSPIEARMLMPESEAFAPEPTTAERVALSVRELPNCSASTGTRCIRRSREGRSPWSTWGLSLSCLGDGVSDHDPAG